VDHALEIAEFTQIAQRLAEVGGEFHRRGWVLGTSGNFSAVVSRGPLCLAITASGIDPGVLTANHVLQGDENAVVMRGDGRPSAETKLHLAVVRLLQADAVLHTHSVWSTLLSQAHADQGGFSISGYEMLKGLEGVSTHEHQELVPIIENSQDADLLARKIEACLLSHPGIHAFLLRGHGLYTWGRTIEDAKRHIEILEFLMEVVGRTSFASLDSRPLAVSSSREPG
jgi:methylthioribulose-1-phosphate dehydratase